MGFGNQNVWQLHTQPLGFYFSPLDYAAYIAPPQSTPPPDSVYAYPLSPFGSRIVETIAGQFPRPSLIAIL